MFDFIVRLRARPLAYRRKVALWLTVGITGVITLVWALSLPVRFDTADSVAKVPGAPGPFEAFVGQVKAGADSLKDSLGK